MKNPSVQINDMPDTLQRLRDLKPEIQRKMSNAVEAATVLPTLKDVEALRRELGKDYLKMQARYLEVLKEFDRARYEFDKTFSGCVRDLYDGADLELSKISHKRRVKEVTEKTQAVKKYFGSYAVKMGAGFVTFEKSGINVTLEEDMKKLQGRCRRYIDSMAGGLLGTKSSEKKLCIVGDFMAAAGLVKRLRSWVKRFKR